MVQYGKKFKVGAVLAGVVVLALLVLAAKAILPGQSSLGGQGGQQFGQAKTASAADNPVYELVVQDGSVSHQAIADLTAYLQSTDQPVFVDFWADWCSPCQKATPSVEKLASEYAGRAHIVKVNVDYAPEVASAYKATAIPHFVVIQDSQVVQAMSGYGPASDARMRKMINSVLAE